MSKYYEVRFYTKKGGEQSWIIHVEAKTAKEAKEIAIHKWACDRRFSGSLLWFTLSKNPLMSNSKT